jgi:hypothetical protein
MEILRVAPYGDISLAYKIPTGYVNETEFSYTLTDLSDLSTREGLFEGFSNQTLSVSVSGRYDNSYRLEVSDGSDIIHDETYEIVRPYVDPATAGETASEVSEYRKNEEIARAVIDSVVWGGFYYKKKTIETVGLGADYLPLWGDVKKLIAVYENNTILDLANYEITKDKTAIVEKYDGTLNRSEQALNIIPTGSSDQLDVIYTFRGFPRGYDYKLVVESGYTSIPSDIVRATQLLIEDISCGKLDYYKRYIADYNTDQFKIKFDTRVFEGTGNIIVDKILSKYTKSITRPGVL